MTASVLAADADQSNIFKVSVFLLNQNHQRFSSSAASALPQSPTGSTMIPSTLRGCSSNIFWLKYVQCSLLIIHTYSCLYVSHCRYLGLPTPEDNLAGYQRSDVTAKVIKIDALVIGDTSILCLTSRH